MSSIPSRPVYDHLLDQDDDDATESSSVYNEPPPPAVSRLSEREIERRASLLRMTALLAACWFSVGSHYSSYVLGPIKSRLLRELGSTHTEFSLLLSAYSLNSTWTPLVGGIMASRLGTTLTSIIATSIILLGQALLLAGNIFANIRLMALGMFIFGLGVSPLAVVQETIIVRFFKSRGLGVSMAFGLVAGKLASFISSRTTYPLAQRFGTTAPFYVSTFLAASSVFVNLIYLAASRWLVDECDAIPEAPDIHDEADRRRSMHHMTEAEALEKVAEKKRVKLREVTRLGDVFWMYVGLNVFCGMIWHPFAHLAANVIEVRYDLPEATASIQASYLLAGSFFLYPICGYIVDTFKRRPIIIYLLLVSSTLTALAYTWFVLPPSWTHTAWPGIVVYAGGQGFAPLLLVVIVPKIVPTKYISTALGIHKCLETTGTTFFQTIAGLILDGSKDKDKSDEAVGNSYQWVLNVFLFFNICQLVSVFCVWYLQSRKKTKTSHSLQASRVEETLPVAGERQPLLSSPRIVATDHQRHSTVTNSEIWTVEETPARTRGRFFVVIFTVLVVATWALFLGTAWFRLGTDKSQ